MAVKLNYCFNRSLGYLTENMDSSKNLAPLFEVQLELQDPEIVFMPPLDLDEPDGFITIIEELIGDILDMAKLIPRVARGRCKIYNINFRRK